MNTRWAVPFSLPLLLYASSASAQNALTVRAESESREPLSGALIALVTSNNQVIEERLSNSVGSVIFNAPAGDYLVRVRRIGFTPFYSKPVTLPRNEPLILQVESPRVVLQAMVVTASAQCGKINPDAATLASVWEEISKGLRASQLSAKDLSDIVRRVRYERHLREDGSVISSDSTIAVAYSATPFAVHDPSALVTAGYVTGDEYKGWVYSGPDEQVLLSDSFAATHCFRAVRERKRPGQIGVSFQPVPKRRKSDIRGVAWLDQQTSELRDVEFEYVNAGVLDEFRPGGFTRFKRMPSGAMMVREWQIRMPRLTRDPASVGVYKVLEIVQSGGRVYTKDEILIVRGSSTVVGMIFDSLAMRPLSGAAVSLGASSATTDGRGHFLLTAVPNGSQVLSFRHPSLAPIATLAIETGVDVRGDTVRVSLATPSRRTVWTRICGSPPDSTDAEKRGILFGTVRNENGRPVDEAVVAIHHKTFRPQAGPTANPPDLDLKVRTDADGHYSACGFKDGAIGTIRGTHRADASATIKFSFDSGLIQRVDLTLTKAPLR